MQPLSIIPYYGGKAKMAALISDMLDYKDSDIYVELFGGGCRVLLNKPRHPVEIYNETSAGLCAMLELLSKRDTAMEFIERLYKTEFSEEWFKWALDVRNCYEDNYLQETKRKLNVFFKDIGNKYGIDLNYSKKISYEEKVKKVWDYLDENERRLLGTYIYNYNLLNVEITKHGKSVAENTRTDILSANEKMDLAVATYIIYQQSFNAAGTTWNKHRFKTNEDYYRRIDSLYDIVDRLEGVMVTQVDAFAYFYLDDMEPDGVNNDRDKGKLKRYLENPRVMMYCDPPYLAETPLDGKKVKTHNPGKLYKQSWSPEEHVKFLKSIQKAKCKLLVSGYNYENNLYDHYLNAENGWKKLEYPTMTSASSGTESYTRYRTECLWYNYEI